MKRLASWMRSVVAAALVLASGVTVNADVTIDDVRDDFVVAQNHLAEAATAVAAEDRPAASASVDQTVALLGDLATRVADPSVQSVLGTKAASMNKKLAAAQAATGRAKAAIDAVSPPKKAKVVLKDLGTAARGVASAASLVGRPLIVERNARTAGFQPPNRLVTFQIDLTGCSETPVVTVTNVGGAPIVDLDSVSLDSVTGLLTLRMGPAHGLATVEVTACGKTRRRLLYNYGVAAPRLVPVRPLRRARVGEFYDQLAANAVGGVPPISFSLQTGGGFPPVGVILDLNGRLRGTPSIAGTYTFGVCARDASGWQSCGPTTVVVDPEQFTLTVTKEGSGQGTVTSTPRGIRCGSVCTTELDSGTTVTLSAKPAAGSTFIGWSGDCSGTGSCTLTMDGAKQVTATFKSTAPVGNAFDGSYKIQRSGECTFPDSPPSSDVGYIYVFIYHGTIYQGFSGPPGAGDTVLGHVGPGGAASFSVVRGNGCADDAYQGTFTTDGKRGTGGSGTFSRCYVLDYGTCQGSWTAE